MDRSASGSFLPVAFSDVNEHHDGNQFLLIDVELEEPLNDVSCTFGQQKIPKQRRNSEESTDVESFGSANEERLEPVHFDEPDQLEHPPKKSALKKSSSYGCLHEPIPICTKDSSYQTLPKPSMVHSQSMASFFPSDTPKIKRNVSFSRIGVREYPLTLGDHPCVSCGPPTTLDWNFNELQEIELDDYEKNRLPRRKPRQMVMNYHERREILEQAGHTEQEIRAAKRQAEKGKRQRNNTKSLAQFMKVEDAVESAKRKAKRAVVGRSSDTLSGLTKSSSENLYQREDVYGSI